MNTTETPDAPSFADMKAVTEALYDPGARARIRGNPRQYAIDNGLLDADSRAEVKVVDSARDTLHIPVMRADSAPPELNTADLESLQAAGTASTGGSASSAGSAGTLTSTVSSASSAACAGCAGTLAGNG